MKRLNLLAFTTLLSAALFSSSAHGVDLFSEGFDTEAGAKIGKTLGPAMTVTYVDYSNMTVGALTHSITEAPRRISGSAATRGVMLQAVHSATPVITAERAANLVALTAVGGSPLTLTDNYRLKFDAYLRLSPNVTFAVGSAIPSNVGTTEQVLWGVGYNTALTSPMSRLNRTARGSGMWGWLATDGGHGTATGSDASLFSAATLIGGRNLPTDNALYFTPAFGATASPQPNSPANQWVTVDITVLGGQVTVFYKGEASIGAKFYENVAGTVAGGAMVGYEDSFDSISFDRDNQWLLVDNMVVEAIAPPTMLVNQVTLPNTFTGTPQTGTFTIKNLQTTNNLNVSAVNFSGPDAAAYTVSTPMPLIVTPGATQTLTLVFNPPAPNGVKIASMEIVSNDPQQPSYTFGGLSARRSIGGFLEAHYKLDETTGIVVLDATGNVNGTYQVRDPLGFGQTSLLGPPEVGTAVTFTPANSGITGNYLNANIVHTPSFSISLWIKPTPAVGAATRTLFQRDYDFVTTYEKICGLILTPDGNLKYRVAQTDVLSSGPGSAADDEVHHVVITHLDETGFGDALATRCRLYIDGVEIAEATGVAAKGFGDYPLNPTVSSIHFASRTTAGSGFKGDLDDIQIYGVELTPEQVWAMHKTPGSTAAADFQFKILTTTYDALGGTFAVTFPSAQGQPYTLQQSPDLSTWTDALNTVGRDGELTTSAEIDSIPPGKQFYRIRRN